LIAALLELGNDQFESDYCMGACYKYCYKKYKIR